uniref:Uncharacterized protein n=1 Tax=Rhizophora mucronata TaxID=61149 RepID=A0A2P2NUB6_RHIMU
MASSLPGHHH